MCRLLGYVSRVDSSPLEAIGEDLHAFGALSEEHCDGWGMAWRSRDDRALRRRRYAEPACKSPEFEQLTTSARGDSAILHLRLATPGLEVAVRNSHPFLGADLAFAHNGSVQPIEAVEKLVAGELRGEIVGDTDSERYFMALRSAMTSLDPVAALLETASRLRRAATITSLNCLLLDSSALYALSASDLSSDLLRRRGADYFNLGYTVGEDVVTVASTGWPRSPAQWRELPQNHVLEVRRGTLEATVHS